MSSIPNNGAQLQVPAVLESVALNRSTQTQPKTAPTTPADVEAGNRAILWLLLDRHENATELLKWIEATDFPDVAQRLIIEAAARCKAVKDLKPTIDQIESELVTEAAKVSDPEETAIYQAAVFLKEELIREKPPGNIEELKNQRIAEIQAARLNPPFVFEHTTDSALDDKLHGIEWLWQQYIPRGFVTGIVGDQDQGKSMVAQSICDIILRGNRWPDGTPHTPEPDTKLLWIDTEGSIALFHERMKSWGMPRGRFILPSDPIQELAIDDAQAWQWVEAAVEKFQPPMVVIDSLSGSHSAKENANDEMKVVMKKLSALAQKFNIAVLVIHHLSKPAPGVPSFPITLHRMRGASSIPQYCRSILALGTPNAEISSARRLDVIKLNIARKPDPVGYELTDFGPAWGEAPEVAKPRRAADAAIDFLTDALANGQRPSDEIRNEHTMLGIGSNAINEAKKILGVKARREGGKDGRWFLELPAKSLLNSLNPDDEPNSEKDSRAYVNTKTLNSLNSLKPLMPLEGEEFNEFKEFNVLGIREESSENGEIEEVEL